MNFLKSWPGAVCQSSNSAQLSAACPFPHPPTVPTPSHTHPWAPFGTDVSTPDTSGQSTGLAYAAQLQKPHTPLSLLAGERLSTSSPDRYSCDFWGRNLWSNKARPVQILLRNTLGSAAITYVVDIYLKDLILLFLMLFPMLKECCLQYKAKCF